MSDGKRGEENGGTVGPGTSGFVGFIREVNYEVFLVSLVLFLTVELVDHVRSGYVSFFFNIDIIFAVVLVTGAIALLAGGQPATREIERGLWEADEIVARLSVYCLGVVGTLLVVFGTSRMGLSHYVAAAAVGSSVILVSFSMLADRELALSHKLARLR